MDSRVLLLVIVLAAPAAHGLVLPQSVAAAADRLKGRTLRCGVLFIARCATVSLRLSWRQEYEEITDIVTRAPRAPPASFRSDCAPANTSAPGTPTYPNSCHSFGTGFAYTSRQDVFRRVADAPWDALVPLAEGEVAGSSIRALQFVADVSGLNLQCACLPRPERAWQELQLDVQIHCCCDPMDRALPQSARAVVCA